MIINDTFTNLSNSFLSWLESTNTGDSTIVRMDVEYANRALEMLLSDPVQGWDYLTKVSALTVVSNVASMPSDFGRLLDVYADSDGDGKADYLYFSEGRAFEGFRFTDEFTKAAGHVFKATFFQSPIEPCYARYQMKAEEYTGSGTEYLYFPKNLMLLAMKRLRVLDKGLLQEMGPVVGEYQHELDRYKGQHQNNAINGEFQVNDSRGSPVFLPAMRLGGSSRYVGRRNDQDVFFRGF